MQDKLRKLYLYATSSADIVKRTHETIDQYTLKKQQNIQNLKYLLESKISIPAVASVVNVVEPLSADLGVNRQQEQSTQLRFNTKLRSLPRRSVFSSKSAQSIKDDGLGIGLGTSPEKPKQHSVNLDMQRQKKYEKYIDQYMQKMQRERLLEKYPPEQYAEIVRKACKQIRKRLDEQQKIEQVSRNLEQSERQPIKILKSNVKKKMSRHYKQKLIEKHLQNIEPQKSCNQQKYFRLQPLKNNSSWSRKMFEKSNSHNKSKSLAQDRLYKVNLERVEKANKIKARERRRSQKFLMTKLIMFESLLAKQK